jgi:GlcNAc-P-P-Und epimerase
MQKERNATVLVTGSSGFVGTHLVRALIRQGYDVHGLDIQRPVVSIPDYHFVQCDILNVRELGQVLSDCEPKGVVHLAARTDLDGMNEADYAANIEGVHNLLKAVANTPSVERCIYTSSQLVCRVGYVPKNDQEYCPNTIYGKSKVLTEQITRQHDGGGREWCLVRPTTVWGTGMKPHYQRFFRMVRQGRYFHVGYRPLYKSYSYVGNIVYQYQRLLEASVGEIQRRTFYLADYWPISLRAWVDGFQRELGAKPVATIPEPIAKLAAIAGDVAIAIGVKSFPFNSFRLNNILTEYRCALSDVERICGPLPYTMEQGIKETAAWIRTLV